MSFKIDPDYVDVAARLREFYEKYPDGRITAGGEPWIMSVGGKDFIAYRALAYRTPDDPVPCAGTAWEPFPGPTQFTRDSELMNAETSAWGRAIVAAGIPSKKIASTEEVRNRSSNGDATPQTGGKPPSDKQRAFLLNIIDGSARGIPKPTGGQVKAALAAAGVEPTGGWGSRITGAQCSQIIEALKEPLDDNGKPEATPDPDQQSDIPQDDGFQSEPLPIGTDPDGNPF